VVICVYEFGPLNLQPHPGKQWAPIAAGNGATASPRRRRRRATYLRPHGVRHLMAGYDLSTDRAAWPIGTKPESPVRASFPGRSPRAVRRFAPRLVPRIRPFSPGRRGPAESGRPKPSHEAFRHTRPAQPLRDAVRREGTPLTMPSATPRAAPAVGETGVGNRLQRHDRSGSTVAVRVRPRLGEDRGRGHRTASHARLWPRQ
jgi:hypothetical protein